VGTKALKSKHISYTIVKPQIYTTRTPPKIKNKTKNQTKPHTHIFTKAKENKITK